MQHLNDLLRSLFHQSKAMKSELKKWTGAVERNEISPFKAADILVARYRKELK